MTSGQPKISIITVVRNSAIELENTIQSVLVQNYPHIEYIVIDGGSDDGTVEVIKKYSTQISSWVSEPDRGIYDAMNKGLAKATGEWVSFMNAGDLFFNDKVVSAIFNQDLHDAQVLFGDSIARYPAFDARRKALPVEDLWKGMICCHQAMFFRTSVIRDKGYRPELFFSADYEMILRLYLDGKIFRHVAETVAIFDTGGISNLKMVESAQSNLAILRSARTLTREEERFHQRVIRKARFTEWLYRLVPADLMNYLLRWLYRKQIVHKSDQP